MAYVKKTAKLLIDILLSIFAMIALFVVLNVFITLIVNPNTPPGQRNLALYYPFLQAFYIFGFYFIHTRKREKSRTDALKETFSFKEELFSYWKDEGIYLISIYTIFAVFSETMTLLGITSLSGHPLSGTLDFIDMVFALKHAIKIPVLRTLIPYLTVSASAILITILERKRLFAFWNKSNAN